MRSFVQHDEKRFVVKVSSWVICLCACFFGTAQMIGSPPFGWGADFPKEPIKYVIPTTPGGALDILSRSVQPYLQKVLNVSVLLENMPGASHKVGLTRIWKGKPDGYSIICNSIPQNIIGETVVYTTDYKLKDFSYVCAISKLKAILFVNWDSWQTLDDFLAVAKQRPMVGAVSGVGSSTHLAGLVAMDELKVNTKWVIFDSGGEAVAALAGKHVDFMLSLTTTALSMYQGKKIRPLVVLDNDEDPDYPGIPTARQKNIRISLTPAYFGILAPPGTPQERIQILENAFSKAISEPALQHLSTDRKLYISFMSGKDYKLETERQFEIIERYKHLLKSDMK
jgi:tripartite-type tricarboxylate transporter receptor subunit TctC